MMTAEKLLTELAHCTGTSQYHRHWLKELNYTDGVKLLASKAEAYWLIDLIASHQPQLRQLAQVKGKGDERQVWTLTVQADRTAVAACKLMATESSPEPDLTQEIPCTDFPLSEIKLYVIDRVLLLPSEY